jgi:hypothetical protein
METAWVRTPRRPSSWLSFSAVVVLPDPDGPDSSTTGLFFMFSQIFSAAFATLS